jgi:hypothetical protein
MDVGLPEEVELRWLACLRWPDLVRAAQVCSRWHRLGTSLFSLSLFAFVFSFPPPPGVASDASLWEDAFVHEFGDTAAAAVRSTSSVRQVLRIVSYVVCRRVLSLTTVAHAQALDRLWGADESTSIEYGRWTANFLLDTRLYQPSRTVR